MGRNSKLSEKDWNEVERRLIAGEKAAHLADEYKINRAALTRRFATRVAEIKTVANQMLTAETRFKELDYSQQIATMSVLNELRAISNNLATAARFGSKTAMDLSIIANDQIGKINQESPLESAEVLQGISALTKIANESAAIGLSLINANKKEMIDADKTDSGAIQTITRTIIKPE